MPDLESYRTEFPVTQRLVYFNHAAVAPISLRTARAMHKVIDDVAHFGASHWQDWYSSIEHVRVRAAQLIGASPEQIAFVKNTSEGIALAANGLELGRGDKVVSVNGEFPANIYPWMKLQEVGVELDLVEQKNGRIDLQEVVDRLDGRTKVLAISFVQFLSGYRCDLKTLGAVCRQRNIFLVVDAIQGLGAFPLNVAENQIDALSADSHKWLLGPEGIGILYCSARLLKKIKPSIVGWTSVKNRSNYLIYKLDYRDDAGKFECGTLNTISLYGLGASIDLILEIGVNEIQAKLLELTDNIRAGLVSKGYSIFGSRNREESSGIVSFSCDGFSSAELYRILKEENIEVSPRCGKVRVSPHFYNTTSEVETFLQTLPSL